MFSTLTSNVTSSARASLVTVICILGTITPLFSQIWTHDFETVGGYTSSVTECNDGSDYFTRTDDAGITAAPTGEQGSFYFAAQDIDAAPCNIAGAFAFITFDDVDISTCSGLSLTVAAATFNNEFDNADFVHILYDIDNSGTWSNLIWFEGTGGTNVPILVDTDFNGTGDGTAITSTFTDIVGSIAGTGSVIDIRIEFDIDNGGEDFCIDNLRLFGTGCGTPPTSITTGAITGAPFSVDCAGTTDTGTIDFTSVGTFTAGNIYTAQLSDAAGSFASPTTIGTLASILNLGTINITIPSATATGAGYLIRIISDSPSTTGSNSAAFTITQTGTCVPTTSINSGLIINEWSNGSTGNEEFYEFVVSGQCGDLVDIRGYILDDNNGTFTAPAAYSGTSSGIANGHFRFAYDAQWASIPVGSLIVIYNAQEPNPDLPPADPTDANNDSLYVVPHTNPLFERCLSMPTSASPDSIYTPCTYSVAPVTGWGPLSLRNGGDAIQVRNPDGSYYHGVSYGSAEITGGPDNLKQFTGSGSNTGGWFSDGDFFDLSNWSSGTASLANQTAGQANNALNQAWLYLMRDPLTPDCPVTILPVEISYFDGWNEKADNKIVWETTSEKNADFFILERSTDGQNWETIQTVNCIGNSESLSKYQVIDSDFRKVINYYRLRQFDIDGTEKKHYKNVVIDNRIENNVELIGIYNLLGQPVTHDYIGVQIHLFDDGTTRKIFR